MDPLTPDDLLIRRNPVEVDRWVEGGGDSSRPAVALERFQTLERVLRENPLTVDPYLELARIYLQRNRWNDAKRKMRADQCTHKISLNLRVTSWAITSCPYSLG